MAVRIDVQIAAAHRAEPRAVDAAQDLARQLEHERVAGPGREVELVVGDVRRPQLVGLGVGRLVLARRDVDVDDGVREAPVAGPV